MREKKPKKVGRPKLPKGQAKTIVMQARVQPHERTSYANAAKAKGVDLSTWVRDTLNRCLEPRD